MGCTTSSEVDHPASPTGVNAPPKTDDDTSEPPKTQDRCPKRFGSALVSLMQHAASESSNNNDSDSSQGDGGFWSDDDAKSLNELHHRLLENATRRSAGYAMDEPSAGFASARIGRRVADARKHHGINADPCQFHAGKELPAIGVAADRAVRRWLSDEEALRLGAAVKANVPAGLPFSPTAQRRPESSITSASCSNFELSCTFVDASPDRLGSLSATGTDRSSATSRYAQPRLTALALAKHTRMLRSRAAFDASNAPPE